jgi:fructose-1,6-bisphosphatase
MMSHRLQNIYTQLQINQVTNKISLPNTTIHKQTIQLFKNYLTTLNISSNLIILISSISQSIISISHYLHNGEQIHMIGKNNLFGDKQLNVDMVADEVNKKIKYKL